MRTVTTEEIAKALGITRQAVFVRAENDSWPFSVVKARGRPRAYPFSSLPRHIQDAIHAADIARIRGELKLPAAPATEVQGELPLEALPLGEKALGQIEAKLAIFEAYEALKATTGASDRRCREIFAALAREAAEASRAGRATALPQWLSMLDRSVFETVRHLSAATVRRIVDDGRAGRFGRYARKGGRRDTGVLDVALDPRGRVPGPGAVATIVLALISQQPHLSARAVRNQVIGNLGSELALPTGELVPVPPLRTFQTFLAKMRKKHASALLAMTNPDGWRSKYEFAIGEQDTGDGLNDLWQIDASPVDLLLLDGRHSVYVLIDLWSRRSMVLVTKTPRAAAVIALLRRAILAWGVPNTVKTDNGSDFKARLVRGVLKSLKIEAPLSPAFTPTDKGHVERVIGTLQHDFAPRQPGYIGHSVADRAAIEARRSFADRIGDRDDREALCIELDQSELQRRLDRWCEDDYAHRPHEGLEGRTPARMEIEWTGAVRRVEDPRALDLLLWDLPSNDGLRTVTKKGLRIERAVYWGPGLVEGETVRVRMDPGDMGRAYVYSADDDAFVTIAEAPERLGLDRAKLAVAAKAEQRRRVAETKAAVRRARRTLEPLHEVAERLAREALPPVVAFPKPTVAHETPALAAATDAIGATAPMRVAAPAAPREPARVIEIGRRAENAAEREQREKRERFERWQALGAQIAAGGAVSDGDRRWHALYGDDPECRTQQRVAAMRARQQAGA